MATSTGTRMDWSDRRMVCRSGNQMWHSDSSFKHVPAQASLLCGRQVPPKGGETEFVSCRVAAVHARHAPHHRRRRRADGVS